MHAPHHLEVAPGLPPDFLVNQRGKGANPRRSTYLARMRTLLLLILTLLLGGCGSLPPAGVPGSTVGIRVATYNIRAGTDLQRRPNLDRVAALLDSLGVDVVLLQEVDRATARSGGIDQLGELSRITGMHGYFAPAMDFDGGEYGIALLSRFPLLGAEVVPLPVEGHRELTERYYEPRTLLHAVIDAPGGPIHLLNTHLDHHGEAIFRAPQIARILEHLSTRVPSDAAAILAGDLNAEPTAPELAPLLSRFSDAWAMCGDGPGLTYPADRPVRRIDYVLLRGLTCTAARVPATEVSDHRPVVVDLRR
jgi:endonuclease/exonuclease/phosphatase family metal-dependent hydrolase